MIDLEATRERMLAEVGASAELLRAQPAVLGGSDPRPAPELRILLRRSTPAEILPELDAFLARSCADVPAESLQRDLLSPLKKAVGNAHKRGNLGDARKLVTVEVVLTAAGVFVEVRDEGAGFDVPGTLALFRAGRDYFAHSGSGFRRFTKARSLIAFDHGGSTFRLRFLRDDGRAAPSARASRTQATGGKSG